MRVLPKNKKQRQQQQQQQQQQQHHQQQQQQQQQQVTDPMDPRGPCLAFLYMIFLPVY